MLLVPRQLKRSGMTGDLPYYGGRLTPAQAYAAQHADDPAPPAAPPPQQRTVGERLAMLDELRAEGTVDDAEYEALRARIVP